MNHAAQSVRLLLFVLVQFTFLRANAQTQVDLRTQSKSVDFSNAVETKPARVAASLPATCNLGDLIFLSSAPNGANIYGCVAKNTWASQGGSAGGPMAGGISLSLNQALIGARNALNLIAGDGVAILASDTGTQLNIQIGADTGVQLTKSTAQSGASLLCSSATGSSTMYGCSMNPTLTIASLVRGAVLNWIPDVTCSAGGIMLNIDSLGAIPVQKADGVSNPSVTDCVAGNLKMIWFDGTAFRLLF